jgi:hypothetical protein
MNPMPEFCLPILGFGDEQSPPVTVTWRDGTVLYRGILGTLDADYVPDEPQQPSDNVVSFSEFKENRNALKEKPL